MNALYIRFEMAFEGEEQQVGFMTGLDDTGMDEDEVEELLSAFNFHLACPPYRDWESTKEHYPGAYFTRAGYLHFQEAIQRVIDAVAYRNNGWEVIPIHSYGFPEEDLYYRDEHQVIVKTYYATDDMAS